MDRPDIEYRIGLQ